jgi:flagellar basal-body rod protein FlgF
MENAQLISLSRQIALQRQMDVVANNMANINTTGFKAQDMLFQDFLMPVASDNDFKGSDRTLHFTEDWATASDLSNGPIEDTGDPLNVALQGDGFFAVQTPAGERYTRNGAFSLDANGTLVDLDGNPVLSEQGPIELDPSDTDIQVARDGTITTSSGPKGKLKIVTFADAATQLTRQGDNLFAGSGAVAAPDARVIGGAIERSNVSGVTEMAAMVRVTRAYESLAALMQRQDDMRNSAVQRLGDLNA